MKKILSLVIVLGFVIMLGAAGSADFAGMSVVKAILLETLGVAIVLFGMSALMHYNRYVKMLAKKNCRRVVSCQKSDVSGKIILHEKELC